MIAAQCLLAAMGREVPESEHESARMHTGALIVVEIWEELRAIRMLIRKALTKES